MPKEWTHWTLAERTYRELHFDSPLRPVIKENKALFLTGAVLPDTPYYVLSDPYAHELRLLGNRLHDTEDNSFEPVARVFAMLGESTSIKDTDRASALMAGVVSHICADIVFHPFVYYFCGSRDLARHFRLEGYMDLYFLRQPDGPPVRYFRSLYPGDYGPGNPEEHCFFLNVVRRLYNVPPPVPNDALEKILRGHARFQRQFDRHLAGWMVRLAGLLPGIRTRELAGLFYPSMGSFFRKNHPPLFPGSYRYRHPVTDEKFDRTIDQLAEEAVNATIRIFRILEKQLRSPSKLAEDLRKTEGANLLTGLPGEKKEKMTRFDTGYALQCLVFGGYNL